MNKVNKAKKVSAYYDKIANHYEEDYLDDPYWKLYFDITWHNIKKHLPKDKKSLIIDVGGGTGFWARRLARLGYSVVVTDISEHMLKIGKMKAKKQKLDKKILFTYGNMTRLKDIKSDRYDLVLAQGDPISYSKDPVKAIKELVRIAKPGSRIIASVDNLFSTLRFALRFDPKKTDNIVKTHKSNLFDAIPQFNFTPEQFKAFFQNGGCEVLSLIGKPVLVHEHDFRENPFLSTDHYNRLLDLELKFNSHPSLVGAGGHLEIVAKKSE